LTDDPADGRVRASNDPACAGRVPKAEPGADARPAAERRGALTFSALKYLFECPYQFKLRFLDGFNPPIHEALGYGRSVHDVMAEVHKRAIDGGIVSGLQTEELVGRHLNTGHRRPHSRAMCPRYEREPGLGWPKLFLAAPKI
jgi:DNA helicase II / ATP-dependent DNA helicase PcrA